MIKIFINTLFYFVFLQGLQAQDEVIVSVGDAMKIGSVKELTPFIGNTIDINVNGVSSTYSKAQAEAVLKDFFQKNNAKDFRYIHQGASPQQGLKYTIGKLTTDNNSFRVVMLLKTSGTKLLIDTITFSKE